MKIYVGHDIGGSKFMVAAANTNGKIIRKIQAPTPKNFEDGLKLLKGMTYKVAENNDIISIGAACGGPLDWKKGVVSPLHMPSWRNINLKMIMEKEFACPFYVDNDCNVAALGEYNFGKHKVNRLVYITISTGMGGALLIDGKIYRGLNGEHPEIAHQAINHEVSGNGDIFCECGVSDCLEGIVSGNAIRRIYGKPAEQLEDETWNEIGKNIGKGLRNIIMCYAPNTIVLGGGITYGAKNKLLKPILDYTKENIRLVPIPNIVMSKLGYETALVGAIALAMRGVD